MPESAATSGLLPERFGAALLVALGGLVMLGWAAHSAPLVHLRTGYVAMVFKTALCFTLSGLALLTRQARTRAALALIVAALSALVFAQYLFGVDLRIDRAFDARWADPINPYPGRMSPQTALCFIAASVAVLLRERAHQSWSYTLAQLLVLIIGVVGLLSLIGYSLRLELLYSWYRYTRMALHTAAGMTVLAVTLWLMWYRIGSEAGEFVAREERRLTVVGAALIVLVGATAGGGGFIALAQRSEQLSFDALSDLLDAHTRSLAVYIEERREDAQLIATRPHITRYAAAGAARGDHGAFVEALETLVHGAVRRIEVRDLQGSLIAAAGAPAMQQTIEARLDERTWFFWRDASTLQFASPLSIRGEARGSVIVQTSFTPLDDLIENSGRLSASGDLRVCTARDPQRMQCLPTRLAPRPVLDTPRFQSGVALPMSRAIDGEAGALIFLNYRNRQSVAAYAPLTEAGIGLVLQQDAEEVYEPIRETLQTFLIALAAILVMGVLLLRSQMTPLLRGVMQSRNAAAANAARISAIMENVPDGVITIDEQGLIAAVNPAVSRMFGYAERDLLGASIKRLMPPRMHAAHDAGFSRYIAGAEARLIGRGPVEVPALRADGSEFPMELTLNTMQLNGQRFFVGIMHDITQRNENARIKNEFVSVVSHELRTPLTSIRGSLGLVNGGAAGELPPKARQLIELAWRNTDRLARLINDILDVEKIEAGEMQLAISQEPLRPLLQQALDMNAGYAHTHQVSFVLDEPVPDAVLETDAQRLLQVLANLLSNAAKFSPPRSSVRLAATTSNGRCRISVSDEGCGVPAEFQPRLFEKFSQADSTDHRQKGGTGLGLAISKALIERMGGAIGFNSSASGATFWIDVPEARAA